MNEVGIDWESLSAALEKTIPSQLAEKWDNVGLQIDCNLKSVKKILLCLDVLLPVVNEAIEKKADLIISHHPLIFSPIKKIDSGPEGIIIRELIRANISLFDGNDPTGVKQVSSFASYPGNKLYLLPSLSVHPLGKCMVSLNISSANAHSLDSKMKFIASPLVKYLSFR